MQTIVRYINDSRSMQTQHANPLSRSIPSCFHRSFRHMTCFQHPPPEVPSIKSTMFNQNSKVSLRYSIIGRSPRVNICMALLTKLAEIKKKERREKRTRAKEEESDRERGRVVYDCIALAEKEWKGRRGRSARLKGLRPE